MKTRMMGWMALVLMVFAAPVHADRIDELENKILDLQRQVEQLREEKTATQQVQAGDPYLLGTEGDSARTRIGGYMELHYNDNVESSSETLDFHRFVLLFSHELADWIQFYSEVEIEHAFVEGDEESGEVELEQAYVDFLTGDHLNFRAGVLLTPAGIINQYHEPATFNGVERPFVDTVIIPTTWSESGAGIFGEILPGLSYQLNIMGGLEAEGFSASKGLRDGRQKAFKTTAEDLGYVARLDYKGIPGLSLGAAYYTGDAAQELSLGADVNVDLLEGDFRYGIGPFDFRGEIAQVRIGDTATLNAFLGKTSGQDAIAEKLLGWYLEGAWHFGHFGHFVPLLTRKSSHDAALFVRYEDYDTQKEMPSGFARNPAYDRTAWTMGLTYRPIENLAVKLDYQDLKNEAGSAEDQINMGIGWEF